MERLLYGSRDHARTPMQWNDKEYAGFSETQPWIAVNPDYLKVNVESEERDENSVLCFYRRMIALRKSDPALVYGSFEQIRTSRDLFAYYRQLEDKKYLIVINLTDKNRNYPFKISQKLLSSNYEGRHDSLRPYEANIYQV